MKLISYRLKGKAHYGIVKEGGVLSVSSRLGDHYPTLRDLLEQGALDQLTHLANNTDVDLALDDIEFTLPIPNAQKIMCAGRNYRAYHEVQEEGNAPKFPSIFGRFINGFAAHQQEIYKPKAGVQLDYEGELVAVIGKRGRHISEENALDHVLGYTCMNEGTVREWMKMGTQNTPAKNFYRSGGIGPWIVTTDEISDPAAQRIITRRNGEIVQDGGTDMMIFDTQYLIAHTSKFTQLEPGDMIATGSPGGSIIQNKDPVWLQEGDELEIEIPNIGTLRNKIVNEQ